MFYKSCKPAFSLKMETRSIRHYGTAVVINLYKPLITLANVFTLMNISRTCPTTKMLYFIKFKYLWAKQAKHGIKFLNLHLS